MNFQIDLNADLGEECGQDQELMPLITSANVATGAHAGNDSTAMATMMLARHHGVVVGAHPGYPDRENFGRKPQNLSTAEVENLVYQQCLHLKKLAHAIGVHIPYIKPHGALYTQAVGQASVALGVVRAAARLNMALLMQPVGMVSQIAPAHNVKIIREGFLDRRYNSDGTLIPRSHPNAILEDFDEIRTQMILLVEGSLVDSLCIHGDSAQAVSLAENVKSWAIERDWKLRSVWQRVNRD